MNFRIAIEELRYALRATFAQPAFSALVVVVLGAGLGCVLFMLSAIDGLVLRPLPFPGAPFLFYAGWHNHEHSDDRYNPLRAPDYFELRDRLPKEVRVAGYHQATVNLSDIEQPQRYDGAIVSGDLFGALGVAAARGRTFNAQDDVPGAPLTVVLSDAIWRSRYNADPGILGRALRVNAQPATVIGVMPRDFTFPIRETIWLPARLDAAGARADDEDGNEWDTLLSVPPGLENAARAAQVALHAERAKAMPDRYVPVQPMFVEAGRRFVSDHTRSILGVMLAAVLLVLVVACANCTNLLLTRTLAQRHELAVRAAIGAGRGRLVAHVLAQCLVLAAGASVLALVVGQIGVHYVMDLFMSTDEGPPHWLRFDIDWRLTVAAVVLGFACAGLSGLLPALRASGVHVNDALRDSSKSVGSSGFSRVSRWLVVAEVALSCVLLITTGVMVRSIVSLVGSDLGIHGGEKLLTARMALFPEQYPTDGERVRLFERVVEKLRAEPGVEAATIANVVPGNIGAEEFAQPEGYVRNEAGFPWIEVGSVDDTFLETYQVRLRQGRALDGRDTADGLHVAVVDTDYVKAFVPDGDAIGKRVRIDPENPASGWVTIVGVVDALQLEDIDDPRRPTVLVPLRQVPQRYVSISVRTKGEPLAFAPRLAELTRELAPDTPLYWVRDWAEVARLAIFDEILLAQMFSAFGLIALVLAAAGLYGLIAFNVGARTREIGLRRALGAPSRQLLFDVAGRSALQVALGVVLGFVLGVPFAKLLVATLPDVTTLDAGTLAAVVLVLGATTLVATLIPGMRAMKVDPMTALRYE